MRNATLWRPWLATLAVMIPLCAGAATDLKWYPSQAGYATWAFEDNWPSQGDYDLNDLVVRYRLALRSVDGSVTDLQIAAAVVARGASLHNGLAITLPIPRAIGATATLGAADSLGCPGGALAPVEDGDPAYTTFVIIPDASESLAAEGCTFYNTDDTPGCSGNGQEFTLTISLPAGNGINADTLEMGINPFIFRAGTPGIEVHLPGFAPTAAADHALFATDDDATSVDGEGHPNGHYYLTATNLPWAIDVPVAWSWPTEETAVVDAYGAFATWAQSNGRQNANWFENPGSFGDSPAADSAWTNAVAIQGACPAMSLCDGVVCQASTSECMAQGTCNPTTGTCEYPTLQDGSVCQGLDGNGTSLFEAGTFQDGRCVSGFCIGTCALSLTIDPDTAPADAARAPHCERVTSTVTVAPATPNQVAQDLLRNLTTVDAAFFAENRATDLSLPRLTTVGGTLSLQYISAPVTISFPGLTSVQTVNAVYCQETAAGSLIEFPALATVSSSFNVYSNYGSLTIQAQALTSAQYMRFSWGSAPLTLEFPELLTMGTFDTESRTGDLTFVAPKLTTINGDLKLAGYSNVTINVPSLETITGKLSLQTSSSGTQTLTATALNSVAEIYITNISVPFTLSLPSLTTITNRLYATLSAQTALNLPNLHKVTNLLTVSSLQDVDIPTLQSAGGMVITSVTDLTDLSLSTLTTLTGDLTVQSNPQLATMNLDALAQVGGSITIKDNPNLCFGYQDLIAAIQPWSGNWTISGNDTTCDCSGTEVDWQTDTAHCGGCNNVCTAICTGGYCAVPELAFSAQPRHAVADTLLGSVMVQIQDQYGRRMTSSTDSVTLALNGNGSLTGTTTVQAVRGVAVFDQMRIASAGTDFSFTATSGTLDPITSNAFDLTTCSGGDIVSIPTDGWSLCCPAPGAGRRLGVEGWDIVTNVVTTLQVGCTIYLGGKFDRVAPVTGAAVGFDTQNAMATAYLPEVNGTVWAMASDGNGGFYVGGTFTGVGGVARRNAAHLAWNGSTWVVGAWNPSPDDAVYAIALDSALARVYLGGRFYNVAGTAQKFLGAVTTAGALVSTFRPVLPSMGYVRAIAFSGSNVYVAGDFTTVGGVARNRAAALDASGVLQPFDPNVNNKVYSMVIEGSAVILGGDFTRANGTTITRNRLAAFDSATGALWSWDPNANGKVSALRVGGSTLYVGGTFSQVQMTARIKLAALNVPALSTDLASLGSWAPSLTNANEAASLLVADDTVYVGLVSEGASKVGGVPRGHLFAVGTDGTTLQSFDPRPGSYVYALAISGNHLGAGGAFHIVGGESRPFAAALGTDGTLKAWNPSPNGQVNALAAIGDTIYMGGQFTMVGGTSQGYLAAVNNTDGALQTWNPVAGSTVRALAVQDSTLYVGGQFTFMAGASRNYLAAFDSTGSLLGWNPAANGTVMKLTLRGPVMYTAGSFTQVASTARSRIAAVDVDGTLLPWNPGVNNEVYAMVTRGPYIYLGGMFSQVAATSRSYFAKLDAAGVLSAHTVPSGSVSAIAVTDSRVYIGGNFTLVSGQSRGRMAAFDLNGTLLSWNPALDYEPTSILPTDTTVRVAGRFFAAGAYSVVGHTLLDASTGALY